MKILQQAFCGVLFLAIIPTAILRAEESKKEDQEIEQWIDQLIEISDSGYGYSSYYAGSEFLPYPGSGKWGMGVLGAPRAKRSGALCKIVEKGADAVPLLLKHIGDERPIKIPPLKREGILMWMSFDDEYDYNRLTRKTAPEFVNLHSLGNRENQPDHHAITVGDLCYVALGQIVNRNFSATRYQPTGGLIVNSPTHSANLKKVILSDWANFDKEKHKNSLIEDFEKPDHEGRLIGAYLRLAYYYPETVEPLVLKQLAEPLYDNMAGNKFLRNQLYLAADANERKTLFDAYLAKNGEAARQGILHDLFEDLNTQEADEQGRLHPPLKKKYQARACLMELFGYPQEVQSKNRPRNLVMDDSIQARFIGSLTHDSSQKIGEAVQKLFIAHEKDKYFAPACLTCLANRGFGSFLVEQLNKIDPAVPKADSLFEKYLVAINTSKEPEVRAKLLEIVRSTKNEAYFLAALPPAVPGVDRSEDRVILELACKLLDNLPADTKDGEGLLKMIGERYPDQAKTIYLSFLSKDNANRAGTMCNVLWYGNPLAKELLAPFLDDKRPLPGSSMRICDRAATAISQTSENIKFDSDWPLEERDAQIIQLKKYCQESKK